MIKIIPQCVNSCSYGANLKSVSECVVLDFLFGYSKLRARWFLDSRNRSSSRYNISTFRPYLWKKRLKFLEGFVVAFHYGFWSTALQKSIIKSLQIAHRIYYYYYIEQRIFWKVSIFTKNQSLCKGEAGGAELWILKCALRCLLATVWTIESKK